MVAAPTLSVPNAGLLVRPPYTRTANTDGLVSKDARVLITKINMKMINILVRTFQKPFSFLKILLLGTIAYTMFPRRMSVDNAGKERAEMV